DRRAEDAGGPGQRVDRDVDGAPDAAAALRGAGGDGLPQRVRANAGRVAVRAVEGRVAGAVAGVRLLADVYAGRRAAAAVPQLALADTGAALTTERGDRRAVVQGRDVEVRHGEGRDVDVVLAGGEPDRGRRGVHDGGDAGRERERRKVVHLEGAGGAGQGVALRAAAGGRGRRRRRRRRGRRGRRRRRGGAAGLARRRGLRGDDLED